jgi:hypothetical protein
MIFIFMENKKIEVFRKEIAWRAKTEMDANTIIYPWSVYGQSIPFCRHKELKPEKSI